MLYCYSSPIACIQVMSMLAWGITWIHSDKGSAILWAKRVAGVFLNIVQEASLASELFCEWRR